MPSVHKLMNPQEESQHGHVESTSTRRTWCIISKGGEDGGDRLRITITDRVRYLLPTLWLQDRWDLIHLIRPRTRPSNTRNKNRRKRRSRCNFQGCIISKGGIILMEFYIIFFTYTVNMTIQRTPYQRGEDKEEVLQEHWCVQGCDDMAGSTTSMTASEPHNTALATWHRSLVE